MSQVLDAANAWKERCLLQDGSVFSDHMLWTRHNINELKTQFGDYRRSGNKSFYDTLIEMLEQSDHPDKALHQVAAEAVWLLLLFVHEGSMGVDTKRERIARIWESSGNPFPKHSPSIADAPLRGLATPGKAFMTRPNREYMFLLTVLDAWKSMAQAEQSRFLSGNPWDLCAWITGIDGSDKHAFRHMFLYFCYPESFERICSKQHKTQIHETFANKLDNRHDPYQADPSPCSLDQAIFAIRQVLQQDYATEELDFYLPPLDAHWLAKPGDDTGDDNESTSTDERWYWLMRLGEKARFWEDCYAQGMTCIGGDVWDQLGDLQQYKTRDDIEAKGLGTNDSLACWQFCREMRPNDVIFVALDSHRTLGHGTVRSDYRFDETRPEYKHIREVEWHSNHYPDGVMVRNKPLVTKTLTDITKYPDQVNQFKAALGLPPAPDDAERYSIDTILADGCFLERPEIERLLSRLQTKKNLILQGPPGTGKTWLAKRLAYALIGTRDSGRVRAVQFHPTLSYEDFVCGWRPSDGGRLTLTDGVFLRAIQAAKDNPSPVVVVIEEINRGNPAQIFGELITLLEADKRTPDDAVELAYTKGPNPRAVYVPENLYVIGTMNIADRSLALVDLALRRRFAFATLAPKLEERWRTWMTEQRGVEPTLVEDIERRMVALNNAIAGTLGEQFRVGHSYVTPTHPLDSVRAVKEWFTQVVETEIVPLLEEYWFDTPPERVRDERDKLLKDW